MSFLRKIGDAIVRFMYGRNGMDQLNMALLWGSVAMVLLSSLVSGISDTAAAVGAVIYYLVLQMVVLLGLDTNDLKLLTALIVALFLAVPYWKNAIPKKIAGKGKGHA